MNHNVLNLNIKKSSNISINNNTSKEKELTVIYLGIDQSYTSTGIAIFENNRLIQTDIIRTDKADDIYTRARQITDVIEEIIIHHKVDKVCLEGLSFGSMGNVTRNLAGLQFLIIDTLKFVLDRPYIIVSPPKLKKFATGNGRAKKIEMFESLPKDIQEEFSGKYLKTKGLYDAVDAYFLGKFISQS